MKIILNLSIILSFFFANAQYNKGTVVFKDSTYSKGLIKIRTFGGIKFKPNKESEAVNYDYNKIEGFDIDGEKYLYEKYVSDISPRLLKERITGKITLYSTDIYSHGNIIPQGFAGSGMSFGGGTATIFYIKTDNELIRIGAKIKKKHLEFFSSCPSLIEKIKERELKKREVFEIITYFNNCGQK